MGSGPARTYCDAECRKLGMRSVAKRTRRAKRHGAPVVESVDRIEVFEAAGWRCECCGIDTPRELMGTAATNAPELDHILALSLGGSHTRANVQLLARECNRKKSLGERVAA